MACVTVALIIFITTVNYLREKRPKILPKFLQSWKWLPAPLRSLKQGFDYFSGCYLIISGDFIMISKGVLTVKTQSKPYDDLICSRCSCCNRKVENDSDKNDSGQGNHVFDSQEVSSQESFSQEA